ncbi:MAG: hypothetical protein Q9160_001183 [Pyrenula sp. 1 TL-2023]
MATNGAVSNSAAANLDMADPTGEYTFLDKLIARMDRHLIFPLLEHETSKEELSDARYRDLTLAKYLLLKNTNMHDYVSNLWKELNNSEDIPLEFSRKRDEVIEQLSTLQNETAKISELLDDESVVSQLRSDKVANLKFLEENHGVTADMVNNLYVFGRFQYECGNYGDAAELLYQFRVLSTDNDKVARATWGKLVCEILTTNWEAAMEEINRLKESIETRLFNNQRAQLTARESLVHYALFPFFNYEPARDVLTDLYFSPAYISSIQTVCPWILRYIAAAVITNRSRSKNVSGAYQKQLKDLVRIVRQEIYEYNDPITEFVKALYVDFDFEEAQNKLVEAEEVLKGDFFLASATETFVDSARHLISESYCKIHQRIDIK